MRPARAPSPQADLFEAANDAVHTAPTPAEAGRDRGMAQAIDHANDVVPNWGERAYQLLKEFIDLPGSTTFLAEDVRAWARGRYQEAPTERAWGPVLIRAAKSGLICKCGYGLSKRDDGHRQPSALWQVIRQPINN